MNGYLSLKIEVDGRRQSIVRCRCSIKETEKKECVLNIKSQTGAPSSVIHFKFQKLIDVRQSGSAEAFILCSLKEGKCHQLHCCVDTAENAESWIKYLSTKCGESDHGQLNSVLSEICNIEDIYSLNEISIDETSRLKLEERDEEEEEEEEEEEDAFPFANMMIDSSVTSPGELAPFQTSSLFDSVFMLYLAKVNEKDTVVDLGCGDGRILVESALRYKTKCLGVELDEQLCAKAKERVKQYGVENFVDIRQADIRNVCIDSAAKKDMIDLSQLCNFENLVLILFMLPEGMTVLSDLLVAALKRGCRVVAQQWGVPGLFPAQVEVRGNLTFFLYTKESIPEIPTGDKL